MKSIDHIRWAMQLTLDGTTRLVSDMRDNALTRSTDRSGNHSIWLLGHLSYIEGRIPQILLGEPNPVEHWAPLFAAGTQPTDDASMYPPFDEILNKYRDLRLRNIKLLDEIGENGLDRKPRQVPPGFEDLMTSFGTTLMIIALHNMVHYGQIADARRMAGHKPLL